MSKLIIGDTPQQLGQIEGADAMMIDGKVVTKADYLALVAQVDGLTAKIDRMQTFIKMSARKWEGSTEVEPTFWNLLRVANESPAACLAQVRAEAGRAGFIAGLEYQRYNAVLQCEIEDRADYYAESIRQEVK